MLDLEKIARDLVSAVDAVYEHDAATGYSQFDVAYLRQTLTTALNVTLRALYDDEWAQVREIEGVTRADAVRSVNRAVYGK